VQVVLVTPKTQVLLVLILYLAQSLLRVAVAGEQTPLRVWLAVQAVVVVGNRQRVAQVILHPHYLHRVIMAAQVLRAVRHLAVEAEVAQVERVERVAHLRAVVVVLVQHLLLLEHL
jgi:hypothetical protein